MGWRGAGGSGSAGIGTYLFFGGLLMLLGGVGEVRCTRLCIFIVLLKLTPFSQWIVGNTFPFVVFTSFGAFWLSYSATLTPFYGAYGNYPTKSPTDPGFLSSFGKIRLDY